jgi:hypothetical protein
LWRNFRYCILPVYCSIQVQLLCYLFKFSSVVMFVHMWTTSICCDSFREVNILLETPQVAPMSVLSALALLSVTWTSWEFQSMKLRKVLLFFRKLIRFSFCILTIFLLLKLISLFWRSSTCTDIGNPK